MGDEEEDSSKSEDDVTAYIFERLKGIDKRMSDLVEFLERTDPNFASNIGSFDDWKSRLDEMRREEQKQIQIAEARRLLEGEGYLIAKDANGLDMAKVKKWTTDGIGEDDDIPF